MKKLLVIVGPTATGKTGLGIKLAKKFDGELVSADSRQVYQGMDIVTGKDVADANFQSGYYLINGVRVWLYDVVKPDYQFNVADYLRCATAVIKDIWRRGKLPIIVGGTGLYIKGLIDGIETAAIKPDWQLRKKLAGLSVGRLATFLKRVNLQKWEQMNESDRRNPRRLIRAIEIAKAAVSPRRSPLMANTIRGETAEKNLLMIGLKAPFAFLYQRIDERVIRRLEAGAEREMKQLFKKYSFENSILKATIGYRQWYDYLQGKTGKQEAIRRWQFAEHAYARRQMTWFKKDARIKWFDICDKKWQDKTVSYVCPWHSAGKTAKS